MSCQQEGQDEAVGVGWGVETTGVTVQGLQVPAPAL